MDILFKIFGVIGLIVFLGLLLSVPTWLLWNACLVPAVDGLHEISWLQAWGLQVLVASLTRTGLDTKK